VYQQYDIKKLNGEMAFSSTAMWWRIFRRWYSRRRKSSASGKLDSVKMRFATFPQNGEMPHGSAVQISSLSRVDYGDRWKMLRALSAFE
jgi:hypothetical protein